MNVMVIRENVIAIQHRIDLAAQSVNRRPEEVRLVVVSKKHSTDTIRQAISAGVSIFGENYAEEAIKKMGEIPAENRIFWHMIGHIQSRKAELVSNNFDFVQSVDSVEIAKKLNSYALRFEKKMPILLEFNMSGEVSKFGWNLSDESKWDEILPEIEQILGLSNLKIEGLMTMPPIFEDPQKVRPFFQKLVKIRTFLRVKYPSANWNELSMGTSNDFEIAIQEGATIVRIGQAILGSRIY
jgi:PLP dependent protein